MYVSEELPCEFCKTRNFGKCIKVYSKTLVKYPAGVLPLSFPAAYSTRPCPNPLEKTYSALLLDPLIGQLIRRDGGPTPDALTYAILAYSPTLSENRNRSLWYGTRAIDELCSVLTYKGVFEDREAFASNLLGWVAYSTCSKEMQAHILFKGSLTILGHLIDWATDRQPLTTQLIIYGPFIIDCANAWATRHGIVPRRSTTFS